MMQRRKLSDCTKLLLNVVVFMLFILRNSKSERTEVEVDLNHCSN